MAKRRSEPVPHAFWYQVRLELPVLTIALRRDEAKGRVLESVKGMAAALWAAGGGAFVVGSPRVTSIERRGRLAAQ